jgi:alpha-1,2-mannosyltransferase
MLPVEPLRRHGGWIALAASVSAYALVSLLVFHQPLHVGNRALRFFDLRVYRGAARLILHGRPLYGTAILRGFGFTYPPIAALVFTPLTLVAIGVGEVLVTALNLAALIGLLWLALRIRNRSSDREWVSSSMIPWVAAAALWLEPVTTTIGYGQINLVIAALVVYDFSRPDRANSKGAAIGLAAGLKLTPLIFVPYLWLTGRRRAAAVALGAFAATLAIGFALLPSDAARYWGSKVLDTARIGPLGDYANQSLQGALARLTGQASLGPGWIALIALIALAGLGAAVLAGRRGDEASGFSLCVISGLLASPVSWTHHWAIAVPVLFLLALEGFEQRSRAKLIAAAVVALIGYAYLPQRLQRLGLPGGLGQDTYVLIGLVAIAAACATELRAAPLGVTRRRAAPDVASTY